MSSSDRHSHLEALRRSEPAPPVGPRRPLLPRLTLLVLVVGLAAVVFTVLKPLFFPPREVRLTGVRMSSAQQVQRAASSVQAAGWVEADPFPITVRPLVEGVVDHLEVVEGTTLKQGETVIAVLRNLALENALELARSEETLREAEHHHAEALLAAARSILEQNIHARTKLAERQGELARAAAEVERASAAREAAAAALKRAEVDLQAQVDLRAAGRSAPTAFATAQARVEEARAMVKEARSDEARVAADQARLRSLVALAQEEVEDPRTLEGAVVDAEANERHLLALHQRAQTETKVAERNVEHLTIRAPADGVVLRLEAAPGAVCGPGGSFKGEREGTGSTGGLNRTTGALCLMYDPARLQVRVDLPYSDVPGIHAGTEVEVETKAVPGRVFRGVVSRLLREADITQAKLQVKVRLLDPDALLRPEMICTVRFLVKRERAPATAGAPRSTAVLVPSSAVRGDAVFVLDPRGGGHARRVSVRVIGSGPEWTEVEGDLGITSKLILDDVKDGERVKGIQ